MDYISYCNAGRRSHGGYDFCIPDHAAFGPQAWFYHGQSNRYHRSRMCHRYPDKLTLPVQTSLGAEKDYA